MKKISCLFVLILQLFLVSQLEARSSNIVADFNPTPPTNNPHPAISMEDKKRVDFALTAVKKILMEEGSWKHYLKRETTLNAFDYQAKQKACLQNQFCYLKDIVFSNSTKALIDQYGYVLEIKHPHIIPWSFKDFQRNTKDKMIEDSSDKEIISDGVSEYSTQAPVVGSDEYLIHMYVAMSKTGDWHHLDVVVKEDKDGKLYLKYFYLFPFPNPGSSLPPGMVC
jgi:hypothetical protein